MTIIIDKPTEFDNLETWIEFLNRLKMIKNKSSEIFFEISQSEIIINRLKQSKHL